MDSTFSLSAISVWALTLASLAAFSAFAWATAISISAWALEMAASLEIWTVFWIPRFLMTPLPSLKFWILKVVSSRPISRRLGVTFSMTFSAMIFLSPWISSLSVIWEMISRILPSRTGRMISWICWGVLPRNLAAALGMMLGSVETEKLATASTKMLMASLVGISSLDVKSDCIFSRDRVSTRCRPGMTKHPPLVIVLEPPRPVTIMAVFGGAFLYRVEIRTTMISMTTTTPAIKNTKLGII